MSITDSYKAFIKSPYKSIKHSTYFDCYDYLFEGFRGKDITFVEIGVLGGGSLFMWRDYFGPKARIIGVDLNPNAKKWVEHGFEIFIGSQSDESFWKQFKSEIGKVDVILDDGGHKYEQQIITTECLLDSINDGGMLVVEDTHTSYMHGYGPMRYSFIEYVKQKVDEVNFRFGNFSDKKSERRFWSIEIFESIVAFKVNSKLSMLKSEPKINGGHDDQAVDIRYIHQNNAAESSLNFAAQKLRFIKHIPFAKMIARGLRDWIASRKFFVRKYFNRNHQ